jgi:hypothetical protein
VRIERFKSFEFHRAVLDFIDDGVSRLRAEDFKHLTEQSYLPFA